MRKNSKNEVINKRGNFADKSEVATLSFKGGKYDKVLSSDKFANFLTYVQDHNLSANALVALVLAGMVRPTLTMAIPGMKDKKDKIYSAGQAISTGFLGYVVTMGLTKPLDDAMKKFQKDPEKYSGKVFAKINKEIKELEVSKKDAKKLEDLKKQKKTMELLVKNIPEWAICVPRAMLTIALIPLILKYVFGLEKKKKVNAQQQAQQAQQAQQNQQVQQQKSKEQEQTVTANKEVQSDFNNLKSGMNMASFVSMKGNAKNVSFGANTEAVVNTVVNSGKKSSLAGIYDKFTDKIAEHFTARITNSNIIQKASDKWKDSEFLFNHMMTVTSAVISSVYVRQTLKNKDMEEDKKRVLAVNQGLTFALSTALTYSLDSKLESWWQRLTADFIGKRADDKDFATNYKEAQKAKNIENKAIIEDALKDKNWFAKKYAKIFPDKELKAKLDKAKPLKALDYAKKQKLVLPTNMDHLVGGMGILKKMTIMGAIFRLGVPVLVTPLASILSEQYLAHKRSKKAEKVA